MYVVPNRNFTNKIVDFELWGLKNAATLGILNLLPLFIYPYLDTSAEQTLDMKPAVCESKKVLLLFILLMLLYYILCSTFT